MKVRKLRVLFLLVVVGVIGFFPAAPASSQTSASTSTLKDGVLRLRLGATDHFKWQTPPGADNADTITQGIASSGACGLTLQQPTDPPGVDLVSLTASPNNTSVGFVSDSIGVRATGEGTGQPCGRIDGNQKLTLSLSSRIAPTTGATNRAADYAELDIEGKFSAAFTIKGSLNGGTPLTQTYDTMGSDSGPDSGDGDNYRIRFPKTGRFLFNTLEFSVTSGAISLEGGADGTAPGSLGVTLGGTTDSLIHVVQYDRTLFCEQSETQPGGTTKPTNTLLRLANDGGPDCAAVPIDLEASIATNGDQLVSLRKDLTGQATAQFSWTVTWTTEETSLPVKVTLFDFGSGYQKIQWCLADSDSDTFPERPPTAIQGDGDAVDPWCLTSQHSDLNAGTGKIKVMETYYGLGDPGAKR